MTLVINNGPKRPNQDRDFHEFVVNFSRDPKYIELRSTAQNQITVQRLEMILIAEKEEWETIVFLWNVTLASAPNFSAATTDLDRWNGFCENFLMPFHFEPNGTILMNEVQT